jgi:hypothetical protein
MIVLVTAATMAAFACSAEDWTPPPGVEMQEAEGWTDDGRWFAFTVFHYDDDGETRQGGGVVDTQTDEIQIFEAKPYDDWKTAHPLKAGSTAATCGSNELVSLREDLGGLEEALGEGGEFWNTLSLRARGRDWVVQEAGTISPQHTWSPNCSHIAWTRRGNRLNAHKSDGVLPYQRIGTITVRAAGPVVHIMAHKDAEETVAPLLAHLSKEAWAPHVGPNALKDRDATVLYATDEAMETAASMAATIPGGATVELMTWPSPGDIIVAAGRSVTR